MARFLSSKVVTKKNFKRCVQQKKHCWSQHANCHGKHKVGGKNGVESCKIESPFFVSVHANLLLSARVKIFSCFFFHAHVGVHGYKKLKAEC